MPASPRLAEIEKELELRYEILNSAKKRLAMTDEIFAKTAIKQRIREELLPEIHQGEAEYWDLLAQEAGFCTVEEVDAGNAIVEVVREVEQIENQPATNYPDELMRLLREIRDKLNEPGTPAAAKAKLALPLIPGILVYELELDTENSLRKLRKVGEPIKRLFRDATQKK
jgi:hypothetical protein